jgi:glyoxylase-like metal-dependent hydrolase (beta-lactamase superfamily II)
MSQRISSVLSLVLFFLVAETFPVQAQFSDAKALLDEAAKAMGGTQALRSLKNEVVESEGKQFEHAQAKRPGGPGRQTTEFRYTLTRDLSQPRLRLEWDARILYPRDDSLRYVEIIDGSVGLLQEGGSGAGGKQSRLHPARLASRLREEKRVPAKIILVALGQKSLKRLPDAALDGNSYRVLAFQESGDEFRIYLDSKTKLPARVDILEDDPLEGDSLFTLRYADWRKVDGVMLPFNLRYELNGQPLQEEQIKSVKHNVALAAEAFTVPAAIRNEKPDAKPIASQWLLRRVGPNLSHQDVGRNPPVELFRLAEGVHHVLGTTHNSVIIEMRDHLVVVEAPLYEERSQAVIKTIKERFPGKPIRYIVQTHHHIDHSGGIRGYMAEGAILIVPTISTEFYMRVAKAPHTLRPDSLQKSPRPVLIESHTGPRVLTDGSREIAIYPLATSHAEDFQLIYLPREKILIEADHVSPRKNQIRPAPLVNELLQGIEQLKLDVTTIAGIHGDTGDMQGLRAAVAKAGQQ